MQLLLNAIVMFGGVPCLTYAWRLSQAVIMTTHISHEIDASRLMLTAKVRFGNPTGNDLHVNGPIITLFHNKNLLFTSPGTVRKFVVIKHDEIGFEPISTEILRYSHPDLFNEYLIKSRLHVRQSKVDITIEVKTLINEKIPCLRKIIVSI